MRLVWETLHKFNGKMTCNPMEFTSLELEYLLEFQDEYLKKEQELIQKQMKELNKAGGKNPTKQIDTLSKDMVRMTRHQQMLGKK